MGCSFYSSAFSKNRRQKKKERKKEKKFKEDRRQIVAELLLLIDCCWVTPKNLEGFEWSFLSITGEHLRDNLPRNAHFWQVGLLDIILSEYPDKSHDFYDITPLDRPTSFWKKRRPWGRGSHPSTIHFKARVIKLHGCLTARHCHHFRRLFDLLCKGRNVSSEYLGNMQ